MIDNQVQDAFVFVSSLMRQGAEWINMHKSDDYAGTTPSDEILPPFRKNAAGF